MAKAPLRAPVVLFDFDGTLADSLHVFIDILHLLAKRHNFRTITEADIQTMRGGSITQACRHLGIPLIQLPLLLLQGATEFRTRIREVPPIAQMPEALTHLAAQGYSLAILSSNEAENITSFLQRHHFPPFAHMQAGVPLFQKSAAISRLVKTHGLQAGQVVYVGDEIRDIEGAHAAHIPVISVSWGLNTRAALEAHHPDALIDSASELSQAVEQLMRL